MTPCSPLSFNRRFGGTYRHHLQGRRNRFSKPASKQVESWFAEPISSTLKMEAISSLFKTTAVKTSNPALSLFYKSLQSLIKKNSLALVRERNMPTERPPLVGEVVPTFANRGCCVVSATDPPVVSLSFLDRSRDDLFQVAPQLSSRG
jgi:hypothetical protein